jgi:hypothetical protein
MILPKKKIPNNILQSKHKARREIGVREINQAFAFACIDPLFRKKKKKSQPRKQFQNKDKKMKKKKKKQQTVMPFLQLCSDC